MSTNSKRMLLTLAIMLALGAGMYMYLPGADSKNEKRLSGVIGLLVGYAAGRMIAERVISDSPVNDVPHAAEGNEQ